MRAPKLERDRLLLARYQDGASAKVLAAEFQLSPMRVYQILWRNGFKSHKRLTSSSRGSAE